MKLKFLGATGTVTGSKYLIEENSKKILVDCGLFQGLKELRLRNWQPLPVDPRTIDSVVLTHAHLDHTGYLPLLVKRGFTGPIYCTTGTRDLCNILLPDSGKLQEEDAEYLNRKKYSKHTPALPLYTQEDAEKCLQQLTPLDFEKETRITTELKVCLIPSGHIIGSSFVEVSNGKTNVLFTGDLGRQNDLVLRPPKAVSKADYLIIESTYGNRIHDTFSPLAQLEEIVKDAVRHGGVIIIPAFSVGRSQTILYALYKLREEGRIPQVPIYLNSPMSINAQHIFCNHLGEHKLIPTECKGMCKAAQYVKSAEESKNLNKRKGPMIIISASGMLTGGRVLHHLKAFAGDKRNVILLTGYQATGTRGAALLSGAKSIKIHGMDIPVNAQVKMLSNLSAHADQQETLQWLSYISTPPKMIFVTHGEPEPAEALKNKIELQLGWRVCVPRYGDEVDLV